MWFNLQVVCHGLTVNDEGHDAFIGFKSTPAAAEAYREAAREKGMPLSAYVRAALESFGGKEVRGVARTEAEGLLLLLARGDARLAAELSAIAGAANSDRDARQLVKRLAAVLSAGRGGRGGTKPRKRSR